MVKYKLQKLEKTVSFSRIQRYNGDIFPRSGKQRLWLQHGFRRLIGIAVGWLVKRARKKLGVKLRMDGENGSLFTGHKRRIVFYENRSIENTLVDFRCPIGVCRCARHRCAVVHFVIADDCVWVGPLIVMVTPFVSPR